MRISQSRVKAWNTCQQLYHYKYIDNLAPLSKSRPLEMGTLIHGMIDQHNKGKDPFKWLKSEKKRISKLELFDEELEMYSECFDSARIIMKEYFHYWKKEPLKIILSEGEFHILHHFGKGIEFIFYVDAIAEDPRGKKWLIEHKSGKKEVSSEARMTDLQSSLYVGGLKQSYKVNGVIWNYISSNPPHAPTLLKNGTLSKSKSQRTTWNLYRKEIKKLGLDIKDYLDMKEVFDNQMDRFFNRIKLPINKTVEKNIFKNTVAVTKEIVAYENSPQVHTRMALNYSCNFCQYKDLCKTTLYGGDISAVIKDSFTARRES